MSAGLDFQQEQEYVKTMLKEHRETICSYACTVDRTINDPTLQHKFSFLRIVIQQLQQQQAEVSRLMYFLTENLESKIKTEEDEIKLTARLNEAQYIQQHLSAIAHKCTKFVNESRFTSQLH